MSMIWVAILALFAGSGGLTASSDREAGCRADGSMVRSQDTGPVRSPVSARKFEKRPFSIPWSSPGLDEFDTEEVDETWMVYLDILASVPMAWQDWERPGSSMEPSVVQDFVLPAPDFIPLRC